MAQEHLHTLSGSTRYKNDELCYEPLSTKRHLPMPGYQFAMRFDALRVFNISVQ